MCPRLGASDPTGRLPSSDSHFRSLAGSPSRGPLNQLPGPTGLSACLTFDPVGHGASDALSRATLIVEAIKSAELDDLFDVLERDDPALQVKNAFGSERLEHTIDVDDT